MQTAAAPYDAAPQPRTLNDVPGWLTRADRMLFEVLLTGQTRAGVPGDLLELGVFQGRTAIHIGRFLADGERFTVCDLFDLAADEESIRPGARNAYRDLTQETFERNYLAFHDALPAVVRGHTDVITDHVAAGTCRFAHIDASHMYDHVRGDLLSARKLLRPEGIVVFDDYRTEHTPGTAAAVWEGVVNEGMRIICVTANKFYGTWGDPSWAQSAVIEAVAQRADHRVDIQSVLGQRLLRVVHTQPQRDRTPASSSERSASARSAPARSASGPSSWRRAAVALLPSVVTQAIRSRRRRRTFR